MKSYEYEVTCRPIIGRRNIVVLVYANDDYDARQEAIRLGFDEWRIVATKQSFKLKQPRQNIITNK